MEPFYHNRNPFGAGRGVPTGSTDRFEPMRLPIDLTDYEQSVEALSAAYEVKTAA